jgi:hypothetical protein
MYIVLGWSDGRLPPVPDPSAHMSATLMPADSQRERDGEQILNKYFQVSRNRIVRGATMVAHFAARLPKLPATGTVEARRHVSREGIINYEINGRDGDARAWKDVILRLMNAEMENSGKPDPKSAVTPDNYKFKYKGEREKDGRRAYVFDVNPRKKREKLFKGEIWVDVDTSLTVMETGRLVKNPSVFLKKVQFVREFAILDGVAVPKMVQTSADIRFWGPAEIEIQYSDLRWEEPLSAN